MRKFLMLAAALMPVLAFGEVPLVLGYQGRLLKPDGTPQTGTKSIIFSIYADPTVGDVLWTETQSLAIANGFVSTFVGAEKAIDPTLFTGKDLYLGVTVDGVELRPRQRIGSVGYAVKAFNSDNAAYATSAGHAASADTATHASSADSAGYASSAGAATSVAGRVTGGGSLFMDSASTKFDSCAMWGNIVCPSASTCVPNVSQCANPSCGSGSQLVRIGEGDCWAPTLKTGGYCRYFLCIQQ